MAGSDSWELVMTTPFGQQTLTLRIERDGGSVRGSLSNELGSRDLDSLAIDERTAEFAGAVGTPMGDIQLNFEATIDGARMSGRAITLFGASEFTGTRA